MAKDKAKDKDAEPALLDHVLEEAGIDPAAVRADVARWDLLPPGQRDEVLNRHFHGRERALGYAMLTVIAGGA